MLGRENISLHNKLILSIVQNANAARTPPRKVEGLNVKVTNGYRRNCLQSLYGDAFPQSPRKCRSPVSRDRKFRDRPSPLGPLGKSPSITCEETVTRTQEQQSATDLQSFCSRPPIEDGEEVEQYAGSLSMRRWSPITAPLGVSVHGVGTHTAFAVAQNHQISYRRRYLAHSPAIPLRHTFCRLPAPGSYIIVPYGRLMVLLLS